MNQSEMLAMRARMFKEARSLRAAFPDAGAMKALPVSALPPEAAGEGEEATDFRAALGYLREEMLLVRAGKAANLVVLDDEIACVERLLPRA